MKDEGDGHAKMKLASRREAISLVHLMVYLSVCIVYVYV